VDEEMVDCRPGTGNLDQSPEHDASCEEREEQSWAVTFATHTSCLGVVTVDPQEQQLAVGPEISLAHPEQQVTEAAVVGTQQPVPGIAMVSAPEQQDVAVAGPGKQVEDLSMAELRQEVPVAGVTEAGSGRSEDVAESGEGNFEVPIVDHDVLPVEAHDQPGTQDQAENDFDEDYFMSVLDDVVGDLEESIPAASSAPSSGASSAKSKKPKARKPAKPAPSGLAGIQSPPPGIVIPSFEPLSDDDNESENDLSDDEEWEDEESDTGNESRSADPRSQVFSYPDPGEHGGWSLAEYLHRELPESPEPEDEENPDLPDPWTFLSVDPVQLTASYIAANQVPPSTDPTLDVIDPLLQDVAPASHGESDPPLTTTTPQATVVYESSTDSDDSEPAAKPRSGPRKILPLRKSRVSKATENGEPSSGATG
jgi:hypothetical protein